jgi:hypothetical protein
MTEQQRADVPGQRDWTRDPGRRINTLSWEFHPGTLRVGHWLDDPEETPRLFARIAGDSGEAAVGGIRRDSTGWVIAVAFLVDGNAEARAQTPLMAVELLRAQLAELAHRGIRIATPAELLGSDPFARRVLTVSLQDLPRAPATPEPDRDVLARLDVPAPLDAWWELCDAWGAPRTPDALVRAVQAATWDRATAAYLADHEATRVDNWTAWLRRQT